MQKHVFFIDKTIGFVIPSTKGDVIIGLGNTIARLDWDSKNVTVMHEVDQGIKSRFNDAKCDPKGRIWAGEIFILLFREAYHCGFRIRSFIYICTSTLNIFFFKFAHYRIV